MPVDISQRRIQGAVRRMARGIDAACRRAGVSELVVLCVMDGAFMFTADLVRALRTPARIVFHKASSYRGTCRRRLRSAALPPSLRGCTVLVADTIYDTGSTIARIVKQVRRLTRQVWLAVLVEKQHKASACPEQQAEEVFVGIRVSGDPFLIGYGLDVDGRFRSLPAIQQYPAGAAAAWSRSARRRKSS